MFDRVIDERVILEGLGQITFGVEALPRVVCQAELPEFVCRRVRVGLSTEQDDAVLSRVVDHVEIFCRYGR